MQLTPVFNTYKNSALKKERNFDLSLPEFSYLATGECFYCGTPFDKEYQGIKHNGVDRMNNSEGYEKKNAVACCWKCNRGKSDMSSDEFIDWIEKVYRNSRKFTTSKKDISTITDDEYIESLNHEIKTHSLPYRSFEEYMYDNVTPLLSSNEISPDLLASKILKIARVNAKLETLLCLLFYDYMDRIRPKYIEEMMKVLPYHEVTKEKVKGFKVIGDLMEIMDTIPFSFSEKWKLKEFRKEMKETGTHFKLLYKNNRRNLL